jgi:hypothetical protein
MELNIDFEDMIEQFGPDKVDKKIKRAIKKMGMEVERKAKLIVSRKSVDTGRFMNSIWSETWEDGDEIGFTVYDGVSYGIYHEYGTIKHWVPFFYYGDTSKPVLADWGRRVLQLDNETMLAMGGMEVEISETMPFRKALLFVENKVQKMFDKEFKK